MRLDELDISFITEGITHIEEMPVDAFIKAVKNINMYEVSEKVDGANLVFGLDEEGKFYTSRESKSGNRYYDYHDWGNKFWQTGFKSAHVALEKVADRILKPGEAVEVEILFGELPNAVPYSGEENQIIFLRPVAGEPNTQNMADKLDGQSVTTTIDEVPYTDDGKSIKFKPEQHKWTFAKVPSVPTEAVSKEEAKSIIDEKVKQLEQFMKQEVQVGGTKMNIPELLSIKLNQRPENIPADQWKTAKAEVKAKKEEILQQVRGLQIEVKDVLLNELVRNVRSAFGPELDQGGWIEGVVFRHKDTGEMFKVVDKSIFTAINKFNHMIRGQVADTRNSESIKQSLTLGLANALGHPTLASTSAKRYLQKFGNGAQEILKSLGGQIDFKKAKPEFEKILADAAQKLDAMHAEYQKTKGNLSTKVDFGKRGEKEFKYKGEIDTRTLQVFAELREHIDNAQAAVARASSGADLLNILAGDKLEQLGESLIIEGGNAVPNVGAIAREEIRPTLMNLSQVLGIPASMLTGNAMGSVGKAEFSGDIDIALDANTYDPKEIQAKLEQALGAENVKFMAHSNMVSASFPIEHYDETNQTDKPRTGRVQIDLIIGKPEWLKFGYHSAGDKSKYKGVYRTLLISAVASSIGQVFLNNEGEIIGRFSPGLVLNTGLKIMSKKRKIGKQGQWLKGEENVTPQEFKAAFPDADIDRYGKKFQIDDPNEVAQLLFGHVKPDVTPADLDSFESVLELVRKMPAEQKETVKTVFTNRISNSKLPVPPELGGD